MRALALAFALASLGGCNYISFRRPETSDELALRAEVRGYYDQMAQVFAAGNPDALAQLFTSSITHPMTQDQIRDWGKKFFGDHGSAHFKLRKLELEELSYIRASALVDYAVETKDGKGSFAGVERDELVRHQGRWFVAGWEKVK